MLGFFFEQNKFYNEVLVWLLHSDYLQVVVHNVTLYLDEEDCDEVQSLLSEIEPRNRSMKTVKDE